MRGKVQGRIREFWKGGVPSLANAEGAEKNLKFFWHRRCAKNYNHIVPNKRFPDIWDQHPRSYRGPYIAEKTLKTSNDPTRGLVNMPPLKPSEEVQGGSRNSSGGGGGGGSGPEFFEGGGGLGSRSTGIFIY